MTMVMEGLRHKLGDKVNQSQPLTAEQLLLMYRHVDHSKPRELLMWGAMIVSFRSLLRKSNIVPDKYDELPDHVLRRGDISWTEYGMCFNIRSSKTLKYKDRVLEIPVVSNTGSPLCAVRWVRYAVMLEPADDNQPIFLCDGKPLLYRDVLKYIKTLVKSIGLDSDSVGFHSMRRSGTQFLHSIGTPMSDIKNAGDWKSMAVLVYLSSTLERKIKIEIAAAKAIDAVVLSN